MTTRERAVLITGCSSGIGHAAAFALHDRGYRVIATVRRPEDGQILTAAGVETVIMDVANPNSVARGMDTVLARTDGTLYAVFNNAGYGQPGAAEDLSRATLRRQFETNLFGLADVTNRAIPALRARGEGRIIQHSSVLGLVSLPYRGAYNATKFAVEALADCWRMELAGSGVHVALIEPGPITSWFRENALAAFRAHIDMDASPHRDRYRRVLARLEAAGPAVPFTRGPEAVVKRLIHALESRRPKPRYFVTLPTYVLAALRRALPTRALDAVTTRLE